MNIGKSIKHALIDNDMKSKDLAVRLGVTPAYLSAMSNGARQPSSKMLAALALIFELPVSEFIALGEEKAA